ncbi:Repeat of unknown function (DUF1126)/EF-hand domain pair, putative [Trypanosoma equiperdum]|uniref:DM10 domain-containing protein n=3 Tax=Trypanozoon TaxID=39700 RepID=Q387A9_TRYB2|nr:hypothetical protein, conserved [Trypanosoma brucei gambiense DAL972]XP_828234.1 hypothetical protein, conserved [Trypanosoma brucei brucei TREU927]EAN79122.1 hypothetical protein, conserved [Trypanosoma brucei brucei TREU927]CBH17036.1 hypothetical protein, conserved [Trypanosoma brucei gambiense DAL972]SCU71349.1 Repeat of unknown function (DUF1126)/EF-hand domain pair, putative [Trypanosoma equiperdum]|eukprot:XP_011779300.1 hypothetical protein, conserved [Trypanosoma brucei gambiense DAL972]
MAYQQSRALKKEFSLPMVPGMTCGEEMLRRSYHRTQVHGRKYDTNTHIDGVPEDMSRFNLQTVSSISKYAPEMLPTATQTQKSDEQNVDLTGRVLRFYAYTKELVPESFVERERVRKFVFNVFLEDNTMSVVEDVADNSGIAMPASLKRHIVPLPDGSPITFANFRVGETITFYGRTYMVYDADKFTRDFYSQSGLELDPALPLPFDAYTELQNRPKKIYAVRTIAASDPTNLTLLPEQVRATQQFLKHDGEVLRCDCVWDDMEALHGTKHYLTLYYFLSDDSIALVEKDYPNSGRDPFPRFFRRQRVAKPKDGRFDPTSLGTLTFEDTSNRDYYTDADIRIGNCLHVFGRDVLIYDYDEYTQHHLLKKFGITSYDPIPGGKNPPAAPIGCHRREKTAQELEEVQMRKRAENRMREYGDVTVKFLMRLDNAKYEDEIRRFVLTVYPADDTISIFEPVIRNMGIVGGKFLQRQRSKRPNGEFYTAKDFFVGARLTINGFPFVILSSDERSLSYMETKHDEFIRSDINYVVRKLRAMLLSRKTGLVEAFREADKENSTGLKMDVFLDIMNRLKLDISEQELLSLLRYFDKQNESYVSYEEFMSRVMPEGVAVASDDRPWEVIDAQSAEEELAAFVVDPRIDEEKRLRAEQISLAARGAEEFLTLYDQRRQLVLKEFRAMTDYSPEGVIGAKEFKMCIRRKLFVQTIPDAALDALCDKLFPPEMPKLSLEELTRVFNGTSTLPRNMKDIKAGESK